jgi:CubicO group peptidase (beta-lactamase class C family)
MRRVLLVAVVACADGKPAARSPQLSSDVAREPAAPTAVAEPAKPAPIPPRQLFADHEITYAFADADRKTKLLAAIPKIEAAIANEMSAQNVPGLAVGVVIDGELVHAKGYGVVDIETKTAPDGDTTYRIGSITKSFAALAVLALRDDGVLQLDDPLVRWIPEAASLIYPTRDARPITLRQLLTHTSGLPRDANFKKAATEAELLAQLAGMTLENPPGQEFVYSNLGFALLGIVVSRASHATFADVIAKRVFGPLGMTASAFDAAPKLAPAYEEDGRTRKAEIDLLGVAHGAGGITSSMRDMARYVAFQLSAYPPHGGDDSGPVRRATIRESHATGFANGARIVPRANAKPDEPALQLVASTYGFGWQHATTCEYGDLVEHNGAIDSYRASVQLLVRHGVGVIVLSNFGNANPTRVGERVLDELRATGALQPYVAHQQLAPGFELVMKALLAVYNEWNEDALKAVLARPIDPREPAELAGYKQLHGTCTGFTVKEVRSPTNATFAMTCERGTFELEAALVGNKIGGFLGTSRHVAISAEATKAATTALALIARWDEATFARSFADAKAVHGLIKQSSEFLRADNGACKLGEVVHEALGWGFDAICDRGRLHFYMELAGAKIKLIQTRKLDGGTCPRK